MTNKSKTTTPVESAFYLSPTQTVHREDCRHCRSDSEGWEKLESLASAIEKGYKTCRLCCPPLSKSEQPQSSTILKVNSKADSESLINENESLTSTSELQSPSDSQDNKENKARKNQEKKKHKKVEDKRRYKILAGNGCHQAIAEVKAMLVRPPEEGEKFKLILPDGLEIDATFKNPRLKWLAYNNDTVIGLHWFLVYPKMSEGKLVCFQIIAWDGDMPTSAQGWEKWEFTGLWTAQKNLTVQRSMTVEDIRSIAKETGFIKKFKYSFTNSREWVKNRKLWIGYVYKLLCRREGDTLKIQKVIPFACPRKKPVIKGKGDFKNKNNKTKSNNNKKEKSIIDN